MNMNEQMTIGGGSVPQPLAARLRPETIDEMLDQGYTLDELEEAIYEI